MFKSRNTIPEVQKPNLTIAKARPKVLIVEDDPSILKVFSMLLETNGYEVIKADYALPALFRVVRGQPDIILADLNMPMMNGLELLDQLKAHDETRDIPVVVVTGSAAPEDRAAAFKAGCSGFIQKPVEMKAFLKQIAALLPDPDETNMPLPTPPAPARLRSQL